MALPVLLKDIPEPEWTELKERVKAAKGKLIVIVHPYFAKPHSEKYLEVLEKLFSQKKTPVIVLEVYQNVNKLKDKLKGKNPELIIPTLETSPIVIEGFGFDSSGKVHALGFDSSLSSLSAKLHEIGARTLLVGGMQLKPYFAEKDARIMDYESDWLTKHGDRKNTDQFLYYSLAAGCVGAVYKNLILSNHFPTIRLIPHGVADYPGELHTPDFRHPYSKPIRRRK
ncbi:MAG TPA: hypothetical protein VFF13_00660 [archaeon]|nr:hypothetical protein [archaeon]